MREQRLQLGSPCTEVLQGKRTGIDAIWRKKVNAQGPACIGRIVREAAKRPIELIAQTGVLELRTQSNLLRMAVGRTLHLAQKEIPPARAGVSPKIQPAPQIGTPVNGNVKRHRRFRCVARGKFQLKGKVVLKHWI
jgi:hypothetical protein